MWKFCYNKMIVFYFHSIFLLIIYQNAKVCDASDDAQRFVAWLIIAPYDSRIIIINFSLIYKTTIPKNMTHLKQLFSTLVFIAGVFVNVHAQNDSGHYYTSFDSTKIYYEVKGNGYPVILVHGFIVNGESWKKTEVYKDLINAGYKVISMDLRGNGKSDKPHIDEAYANDAEAKDIIGLATELGIKQYNVIGYSRGSIITARLLVLDQRINKAVMGGMGTDFTTPEWPRRKMFYRALIGDTVKELEGMVKYVKESGLDQLALAYLQKEQPSTSKEVLAKVQQPVLVICGDKDSDNGSARELAKLFPHAVFAQVPGDHGGALATKEFAENVFDFFEKH
ncbi:MAG: alpha/beta hydrolase [Panacibacter sp.]